MAREALLSRDRHVFFIHPHTTKDIQKKTQRQINHFIVFLLIINLDSLFIQKK